MPAVGNTSFWFYNRAHMPKQTLEIAAALPDQTVRQCMDAVSPDTRHFKGRNEAMWQYARTVEAAVRQEILPPLDNGFRFIAHRQEAGQTAKKIPCDVFAAHLEHGLVPYADSGRDTDSDHALFFHDIQHMPWYQLMLASPVFARTLQRAAANCFDAVGGPVTVVGAFDDIGDNLSMFYNPATPDFTKEAIETIPARLANIFAYADGLDAEIDPMPPEYYQCLADFGVLQAVTASRPQVAMVGAAA
jgi:hypothetical protein